MSPSLKRAHEAHDRAARLLADDGITANARQNLSVAKMAALVARGLYEAGRNGDAAEALAMAERMLNTATVQALLPDAERGATMRGQRKGKVDRLTAAIDDALATLGQQATAEAVLRHIERGGSVVDRIEPDGAIIWKDAKGREKRTGRRSFDNKVSSRRN